MQKISPILPKLNKKFIMDFIISIILPIFLLIHSADSSTQYRCGGILFDPADPINRCQDSRGSRTIGQPALKDMLCMKDPTMGCEQYTDQNGDRKFYCCPQLCDDTAKTPIDLRTTPRCTRGVCSTDTTKDCKHVSTGEDYCCPNAASPGAVGPVPGSGGGSAGMATRRPGTSPGCEDFRTDCESKANLCIVEYAYERMYRDCPKTCNVCDGGGGTIECKDLGTDCPDRARDGYCDRAIYHDIMNWQCPKSCNRCGNRRPPRGNPLARSRLR